MPVSTAIPRLRRLEWMDRAELDPQQHWRALDGLARIHRVSRSAAALWPLLRREARRVRPEPLRVLDLATGGGDLIVDLERRARRSRLPMRFVGIDRSASAVERANRCAMRRGAAARFEQAEVLDDLWPGEPFDVITCSLFLHHLDEREAMRLLRRMMSSARRLVVVYDLHRSRLGLLLARIGTRLLSSSPIVRHDGPVSVEAAYTMDEARQLAERTGLANCRIRSCRPARWMLTWSPPQ